MMVLVTINQEFWWSWRELNPRPISFILLFFNAFFSLWFAACILSAFQSRFVVPFVSFL